MACSSSFGSPEHSFTFGTGLFRLPFSLFPLILLTIIQYPVAPIQHPVAPINPVTASSKPMKEAPRMVRQQFVADLTVEEDASKCMSERHCDLDLMSSDLEAYRVGNYPGRSAGRFGNPTGCSVGKKHCRCYYEKHRLTTYQESQRDEETKAEGARASKSR